jgi:hypothetical protein
MPRPDPELLIDVLEMVVDRPDGEEQPAGDLLTGQAGRGQVGDLDSRRDSGDPRGTRGPVPERPRSVLRAPPPLRFRSYSERPAGRIGRSSLVGGGVLGRERAKSGLCVGEAGARGCQPP